MTSLRQITRPSDNLDAQHCQRFTDRALKFSKDKLQATLYYKGRARSQEPAICVVGVDGGCLNSLTDGFTGSERVNHHQHQSSTMPTDSPLKKRPETARVIHTRLRHGRLRVVAAAAVHRRVVPRLAQRSPDKCEPSPG